MSFAETVSPVTMPSGKGTAVGGSRDRFDEVILPVAFYFFMASICRVGIDLVPATTNISWGAAYACLFWAIVRRPAVYIELARRNALLLVAALFCSCSAFWSLTPVLSFYSGILFVLNVLVGFLFAERLGVRRVVTWLFYFGFITQTISVALFIAKVPVALGPGGEIKGLFFHKNSLSMHASVLYLNSIVLLLSGWRRTLTAMGLLLAIAEILLSRSGTGLLMLTLITAVLSLCMISKANRAMSSVLFGTLAIAACLGLAFSMLVSADIYSDILAALGKDDTLTGRTVLWDQAFNSFDQRPWLGVGFVSFWTSSETSASAIWILTGQMLTSFHNIYVDRLVDVGIVGLGLLMAAQLRIFWTSWWFFRRNASVLAVWPFLYMSFISALSLSEYPIFWNSEYQLLFSFAGAVTSVAVAHSQRSNHARPR